MKGRTLYTLEQVLELLTNMLDEQGYGAASELARLGGMPTCAVHNVLAGREYPGEKLLRVMGLKRVVLYEVVGEPVKIPPKRKRVVKPSLLTIQVPPPAAARVIHRMEGEDDGKVA